MTVRVEPVAPPYPPDLQKVFGQIMPPGVPPLTLFTTLVRVPRMRLAPEPYAASLSAGC